LVSVRRPHQRSPPAQRVVRRWLLVILVLSAYVSYHSTGRPWGRTSRTASAPGTGLRPACTTAAALSLGLVTR